MLYTLVSRPARSEEISCTTMAFVLSNTLISCCVYDYAVIYFKRSVAGLPVEHTATDTPKSARLEWKTVCETG